MQNLYRHAHFMHTQYNDEQNILRLDGRTINFTVQTTTTKTRPEGNETDFGCYRRRAIKEALQTTSQVDEWLASSQYCHPSLALSGTHPALGSVQTNGKQYSKKEPTPVL
jgi:hypothetical protein